MSERELHPVSLERMVRAVERVRERLLRSTAALERAQVPYAVIGCNAVAAWVSRVDETAVRNTQDVGILIRRCDFSRVKLTLEQAGFVHGSTMDVEFFLDGPGAKVRDAVHLLIANEKVKTHYASATPDVSQSHRGTEFQVIDLQPLVEMKLNSWRDKDHTWPNRFNDELAARLQQLLDNPEG
jgi:hypothetical protein